MLIISFVNHVNHVSYNIIPFTCPILSRLPLLLHNFPDFFNPNYYGLPLALVYRSRP